MNHSDDDTTPDVPGVHAARAQIGAARLRREALIASGRLPGSASASSTALPEKAFPGYTLLRELHRGGQGVVYVAVQQSTDRKVAVKVLRHGPFAAPAEVARFEREVEVLSRLKHPNIVTIHDCGRVGEDVYLVMDYVAGRPLDAHVAHERPSVRDTLDLFAKICDGVNAAHLRGVIHRDLKPGNILVVCNDEEGLRIEDSGKRPAPSLVFSPRHSVLSSVEPKILDFGLAKLARGPGDASSAEAMTLTGQFIGSLPWASPEQAEGRSDTLDIRTDVYSLGVILYQLLTGHFPYPVSGRMDDVVRHIVQTSPTRPSTVEKAIGHEVETLLLKCLAKEPDRRYQSAGELGRDIRRYLANEPIEAKRDSLRYMLRKQLRRHWVGVAVAMGFALLLSGGLVTSMMLWRRAEQALVEKEEQRGLADQRAEQAQAVNAFMREVLTSVEPENRGADVRLIQVLASASATASERFAGHPIQEAQVRDLLGQVYYKLTLYLDAETEFSRARALWREHAESDDPRALSTELLCVAAALSIEHTHDAERVLPGLVPRMERVFGPDHRKTLDARRSLAITHFLRGRLDEAERILLELRTHPRFVDDDAVQIRILHNLIHVNRRRANTDDRAQNLAILAQGEPLAREQVERSTRHYGPDHAFTLEAQVKLAEIINEQGRHRDAAETCRTILEQSAERLGECHNVRTRAMSILARALGRLGERRDPAELFLRKIECLRQQTPAESPGLLSALSDALPFLDRGGRAGEGEAVARELNAALLKLGGGHGDMAFGSELYVARFVSMQDNPDETEALFQSLLAREAQLQDPRMRARLHLFYGGHLARLELFQQAEQQLMTAFELIEDIRSGTWDTHPDDVILGFIALYEAWGKPDRVEEYRGLREEVTGVRARTADK